MIGMFEVPKNSLLLRMNRVGGERHASYRSFTSRLSRNYARKGVARIGKVF